MSAMNFDAKEVYFNEYCIKCEYLNYPEEAEPCCYCLNKPCNINSHKPIKFKERKKKNDKKTR